MRVQYFYSKVIGKQDDQRQIYSTADAARGSRSPRMLSRSIRHVLPRQSSTPYVVEVEHDNQQTGLREGDQLIVDEKRIPRAGDIGIYGAGGALYACRIYKRKGVLCPIGYEKLNGDQVIFGGVVTRLVRYCS